MPQTIEATLAANSKAKDDNLLRASILIVDDRKENLLAMERVLRNLGADIFKANSGNEALSLMLRHSFAIVLLDVQMPEMDGFEAAKLMKEQESMRTTPIVFVTAICNDEKYAAQAAEIGAVDFILKPINPDILRSKVKVYLDLYMQREQILKLNAGLRQSNEELERFAYICSHDMQEPVRMMNTYSELLDETCAGQLDDDGSKYLEFIHANARRMHKMISDILAFSRIGREEVIIEDVDCNEIVCEVLTEFEASIQATGTFVIRGDLPTLKTSSTLMRVLFQNLIGNAIKFQDGSRVPEVRITMQPRDNAACFCIRDNGIGIDRSFHKKIFTIFQRLHRKEDYPGTGIGLSTCRKFLQLCGGDIWFTSTAGEGSAFFFTVPTRSA